MARLKICAQEMMTNTIKASEALSGPGSISAKACDEGGEKGPLGGSNFSSKEPTVLIQKKNFFSKAPVGKFELPTAPQGHCELAAEPFLWISVKS